MAFLQPGSAPHSNGLYLQHLIVRVNWCRRQRKRERKWTGVNYLHDLAFVVVIKPVFYGISGGKLTRSGTAADIGDGHEVLGIRVFRVRDYAVWSPFGGRVWSILGSLPRESLRNKQEKVKIRL